MPRIVLAALLLALLLGLGLRAELLQAGLRTDDHVQRALLDGVFPIERASWDLYWFGGRDRTETGALIDAGYLPWWTDDAHRVAMLRPLSSVLLALDHELFGRRALGYHLHSLLWLAALIGAAALLLSRVLPPTVAALALLLYALDEAHGVPAGWIANRSTLIATTLALLALWAHVRSRERGSGGGALAAGLLLAALAAGEYSLCVIAYLAAYELLGRDGPLARRLRALLPAATLGGSYVLLRAALGYGPRASGYYLSPFDAPDELLARGLGRMGALAGELSLGLPSAQWHSGSPLRASLLSLQLFDLDSWQRLPSWHLVQALLGLCGVFGLVAVLRWVAAGDPAGARTRSWLLAGSLGSLLVVAGSLPGSRLLCAASLGVCALFASLVHVGLARTRALSGARRSAALLALALPIVVHGLLPATRALDDAAAQHRRADDERAVFASRIVSENRQLLVSASDFSTAAHLPWIDYNPELGVAPGPFRLSGANLAHDVVRTGARTLEVRVLGSDVHDAFAGSLYRPRRAVFAVGNRVTRPGITVTVLAVHEGNPTHLRFELDRALEEIELLHAGPRGLGRVELPVQGVPVRLPRATPASQMPRTP